MQDKENAAIACEVKISVASGSYDAIQRLIERLRAACTGKYKLEVNFSGQFFKANEQIEDEIPDEETFRKWEPQKEFLWRFLD